MRNRRTAPSRRGLRAALAAFGTVALLTMAAAPAAHGAVRIGINISQAVADSELTRMQAGGADVVRFPINWYFIEPRADRYVFDYYDYAFTQLSLRRIRYLPVIGGMPDYLPHSFYEYPSGFEELTRFRYFVRQLLQRYGHNGSFWQAHPELPKMAPRAWQVWNEQNLPGNSANLTPSPATYSQLLMTAAQEIRAADPATDVLLGGMPLGAAFGGFDYLNQLWKIPGARAATDAVAFHTYPENPSQEVVILKNIGKFMRNHGAGRMPLWITEFGWATAGSKVTQRKGHYTQGRALRRTFREMRDQKYVNLQGALWYSWRDAFYPGASDAWQAYTGLFNFDGIAKPAWRAFTQVTGGRAGSATEGKLPPLLQGPSFPAGPSGGFFPGA